MTQGSSSNYNDILEWMREGVSIRDMASRRGSTEMVIRKIVWELEEKHGIAYVSNGNEKLPYGMSNESIRLRIKLAGNLFELRQTLGSYRDVSQAIGLNRNEQARAMQRPYSHDWSITQMERLAAAIGVSFEELTGASNKE